MDLSSIQIRSGKLNDVLGPAALHEGIAFVPADVEFSGYENGPALAETLVDAEPAVRAIVRPGEDAPWASGRIQRVFHQRQNPESERGEKCCMWFTFLAVIIKDGCALGIPFICTDDYGKTNLLFGDDPHPGAETMQTIANAFWSLLLASPGDLEDYIDRMEHLGAGVTIEFGVEDGEPFKREVPD